MGARVRIEAAAIRRGDVTWSVPRPGRHHDVIAHMIREGVPPPITDRQGFVTNTGRFVGRREAKRIAIRAGQVTETQHNDLYSEDLW